MGHATRLSEMNPLCQCGCGREVRKPQNKYVIGHGSFKRRALTYSEFQAAAELREQGVSLAEVAKRFGTSTATISNRIDHGRYVPPNKHAYAVVTQADLDLRYAARVLHEARRNLKEFERAIRRFNRHRED
jgi:transposase-like protein